MIPRLSEDISPARAIHRQQLAFLLRDILESGKADDWDGPARLSGVPESEIEWTCRRLHLDDRYSHLSLDRIIEAFVFSRQHNPRAPATGSATPSKANSCRPHNPDVQHETNAYGFTRSGVKS